MEPSVYMSMPIEPGMMPTNIPDLVWYVATGAIVALMALIAYFLRDRADKIENKLDKVVDGLNGMRVAHERVETRLEDHMSDDNKHCKGLACPGLGRRQNA